MDITTDTIKDILTLRTPKPEGIYVYNSVLLLLFEIEGQLEVLFTKRALTLKHQPGDICLPGGHTEKEETPLETAIRETYEETGIKRENIDILGSVDIIITPYGRIITPFVGVVRGIDVGEINYNKDEVDSVFTVPLRFFINTVPEKYYLSYMPILPEDFPYDRIVGGKEYTWGKPKISELFYDYKGITIWGLTARIVKNFCRILQKHHNFI